jgi:hypothetical protein
MALTDDLGDQASEIEQRDREIALQQCRKPDGPAALGYCLACGELLAGRRWCDADCRDDYERGVRP